MLFVLLILIFPLTQIAEASHCKNQKWLSAAEQIARLDPKISFNVLDFNYFQTKLGYRYRVDPAYADGLYSRTDKWEIKLSSVPDFEWNIRDNVRTNLSLGPHVGAAASFIRFRKDPCEAIKLLPKAPNRMPLRASSAIGEHFNIGDYFLFRGSAGMVISPKILSTIGTGFWGAQPGISYLIEGYYQFHLVRLSETKVRLKVLGHKKRDKEFSLSAGWFGDFEVFGVGLIDNPIEKIVNPKPLRVVAKNRKSNIFMVDYILDLSDPDVEVAFNKVIAKAKRLLQIELANPFKGKDLSTMLLLDLVPLENLYEHDRTQNREDRITRNLKTSSNQNSNHFGVDLGSKIIGINWDKESSISYMNLKDEDDKDEYYVLRSWENKRNGRFIFGSTRSEERNGTRMLFETNDKFKKWEPVNLVSYLIKKKNRLNFNRLQKVKLRLKKALPYEVYLRTPWHKWIQERRKKDKNFGLRFQFAVSPEVISKAPQLDREEISRLFKNHILNKGLRFEDYFFPYEDSRNDSRLVTAEEQMDLSLLSFSRRMEKLLHRDTPLRERIKYLKRLSRHKLYKESGLSFMVSLGRQKLSDLYHASINMSSNNNRIVFDYGDGRLSKTYFKLLSVKAALDDDAIDLIREAESLSNARKYGLNL